jgi:hypothetical protein
MLEVARALRPLGIDFASLTYGAGVPRGTRPSPTGPSW